MTQHSLDTLRLQALQGLFAPPVTLGAAIARMGFVQADPIRAPARAQDLILRHRVRGYRAGDLERRFAELGLEEDFFYAYGFMPDGTARLLHPRHDPHGPDGRHVPAGLAAEVLAFVRDGGPTHPRTLEARFGRDRAVNGWGGFSKATTRALESLHYYGLLRVSHRQDGIRVYEPVPRTPEPRDPQDRLRQLAMLIARILSPVPQASLQATLRHLARGAPGLDGRRDVVRDLLGAGALERTVLDGDAYVWPAETGVAPVEAAGTQVRFLAPFDPAVWDRRRFAQLWGWEYRFEAYTPPAKRRLGYYAMPLLWRDRVIGWVNCAMRDGVLDAVPGFVGPPPAGRSFRTAFDAEVARMERFLSPRP